MMRMSDYFSMDLVTAGQELLWNKLCKQSNG